MVCLIFGVLFVVLFVVSWLCCSGLEYLIGTLGVGMRFFGLLGRILGSFVWVLV